MVSDNGELMSDTAGQRLSVSARCDSVLAGAGPEFFDNSIAAWQGMSVRLLPFAGANLDNHDSILA
jgi:hypothetical protein